MTKGGKYFMKFKLRSIRHGFGVALACVMLTVTGTQAWADWPDKPVTIFVHSGAGSSTDLMARAFAKAAEEVTGQPFVVEVKGKETMPALQRAKPDGYTLATQTRAFLGELAMGTGFYKPEDFQWVDRLVGEIPVFAVRADSPYQTFADIVKAAKAQPHTVRLATYTAGSTVWADSMKVAKAAGVDFNVVPFGSSSETVVAMLGGNADIAATYPSQMVQAVEAKKARVLIVAGADPLPLLPGAATLKQLGYDVVLSHWRGLIAKKGVPDDVLKQIDAVASKVVQTDTFKDWAKLAGVDIQYLGHDEAETKAEAEYKDIVDAFKDQGLIP
jgi:tripartite-type tricarboxylate transporter receptor subunit TctC